MSRSRSNSSRKPGAMEDPRELAFGVPLDELALHYPARHPSTPRPHVSGVMEEFVAYLEQATVIQTEGLFQVTGTVTTTRELRVAYQRTGRVALYALEAKDVACVASLFREWIREIPGGMVPLQHFHVLDGSLGKGGWERGC